MNTATCARTRSDKKLAGVLSYIIDSIIEADDVAADPIPLFSPDEVTAYRRGTVSDIELVRKQLLRGVENDTENGY